MWLRAFVVVLLSACTSSPCYDSAYPSSSPWFYSAVGGSDISVAWEDVGIDKLSVFDGTGTALEVAELPRGVLVEGVRGKTASAWLVGDERGTPTGRVVVVAGGRVRVIDAAPHNVLGRLVVDAEGYRLFWTDKLEVHDVVIDELGTVRAERRLSLPLPFFSDLNVTVDGSGQALLRTNTGYGATAFLVDLATGAVLRVWEPRELAVGMETEGVWFDGAYRLITERGLASVKPSGEVTVVPGVLYHLVVTPSAIFATEPGPHIVKLDASFTSFEQIGVNGGLQAATRDALVTYEKTETLGSQRGELALVAYSYTGSRLWKTVLARDGKLVHEEVCGD
jgi:hypothetical protein